MAALRSDSVPSPAALLPCEPRLTSPAPAGTAADCAATQRFRRSSEAPRLTPVPRREFLGHLESHGSPSSKTCASALAVRQSTKPMPGSAWSAGIATSLLSSRRVPHSISHTSHCFNERRSQLAPQTRDEDLHGIRIPIEILRVDVLSQFSPRDHSSAMVHQVRKHAEFVAG